MLLDEDPATLIHHTSDNFHTAPDKQAISRIHDSLATLKQARELRVRDAEGALKKLGRTLNTLQSQHNELVSSHSSSAHADKINELDNDKFRIAKASKDLEMETERLASRQADLAARLQELELQGVEGGDGYGGSFNNNNSEDPSASTTTRPNNNNNRPARDPVDDEVLLRLKVYRSLGIELERDEGSGSGSGEGGAAGEFSRAIVRNDRKGDVNVVNLDKNFSRFFYANYFWQML